MHLKQKGYCFGVLLIYTITTITLPTVYSSQPNYHSALHNDRSSALRTAGLTHSHPSSREDRERLHLDSRPGEERRNRPYFHNRDGAQAETGTLGSKMASTSTDKTFKNGYKLMPNEGGWMFTSRNPQNEDCSKGNIEHIIPGKFYITGQLETNSNVGYQSDSAVSGKLGYFGQANS